VLLHPSVVADPYERLTALWCDNGVVQTNHMQRGGSNWVEVAVGIIPTYEPTNADAIFGESYTSELLLCA